MSDGANMGISATRALGTILGGEDQPAKDEINTPQEVRARIEAIPLFEGTQPWEGLSPGSRDEDSDRAYSMATDAIAHAFLVLIEEDRSLLEPQYYPDDCEIEVLRGKQIDPSSAVWDAMMKRWPHADDWIGGASGFMVGFAFNTALYAGEFGLQAQNPAIIDFEV